MAIQDPEMANINAEEIEHWIDIAQKQLNHSKNLKPPSIRASTGSLRTSASGSLQTRSQVDLSFSSSAVSASMPSFSASALRQNDSSQILNSSLSVGQPPRLLNDESEQKRGTSHQLEDQPQPHGHGDEDGDYEDADEDEDDDEEVGSIQSDIRELERLLHPKLWGEASDNIFYASDLMSGDADDSVASAPMVPSLPTPVVISPKSASTAAELDVSAALAKLNATYAPLMATSSSSLNPSIPVLSSSASALKLSHPPASSVSHAQIASNQSFNAQTFGQRQVIGSEIQQQVQQQLALNERGNSKLDLYGDQDNSTSASLQKQLPSSSNKPEIVDEEANDEERQLAAQTRQYQQMIELHRQLLEEEEKQRQSGYSTLEEQDGNREDEELVNSRAAPTPTSKAMSKATLSPSMSFNSRARAPPLSQYSTTNVSQPPSAMKRSASSGKSLSSEQLSQQRLNASLSTSILNGQPSESQLRSSSTSRSISASRLHPGSQPATLSSSSSFTSSRVHMTHAEKIRQLQESKYRRETRLAELKRERDEREMGECTFQPNAGAKRPGDVSGSTTPRSLSRNNSTNLESNRSSSSGRLRQSQFQDNRSRTPSSSTIQPHLSTSPQQHSRVRRLSSRSNTPHRSSGSIHEPTYEEASTLLEQPLPSVSNQIPLSARYRDSSSSAASVSAIASSTSRLPQRAAPITPHRSESVHRDRPSTATAASRTPSSKTSTHRSSTPHHQFKQPAQRSTSVSRPTTPHHQRKSIGGGWTARIDDEVAANYGLRSQSRSKSTGRDFAENAMRESYLSVASDANVEKLDVAERLLREAERRTIMRELAIKEKEEAERNQLQAAPFINPESRRQAEALQLRPIHERLGELARQKFEKQQELQAREAERLRREATFTPKIDRKSKEIASELKNRRMCDDFEVDEDREESRPDGPSTARKQPPSDQARPRSAIRTPRHRTPAPATDISAHVEKQRIARAVAVQLSQQAAGCTFAPQTNPRSKEMVERSALFQQAPTFLERQQTFAELQAMRLEHLARVEDEAQDCTFKPAIAPVSERVVEHLRGGRVESAEERATRLSYVDAERRRAHREQLQQEAFQKAHTFKPDLGLTAHRTDQLAERSRSRSRGQRRDDESARSRSRSRSQSRARSEYSQNYNSDEDDIAPRKLTSSEEAELKLQRECTFRPQISRVSQAIVENMRSAASQLAAGRAASERAFADMDQHGLNTTGDGAIDFNDPKHLASRIEEWRQERERRLYEAKRARELEELKECTFVPKRDPKPTPKQPDGPIIVRGLNRFLELKQMASKQVEEQKQREAKVFCLNVNQKPSNPPSSARAFTVPKSFSLESAARSSARAEQRQQRFNEERCRRDINEFTFHPQTQEHSNRALIRQMLEEDEENHPNTFNSHPQSSSRPLSARKSEIGQEAVGQVNLSVISGALFGAPTHSFANDSILHQSMFEQRHHHRPAPVNSYASQYSNHKSNYYS